MISDCKSYRDKKENIFPYYVYFRKIGFIPEFHDVYHRVKLLCIVFAVVSFPIDDDCQNTFEVPNSQAGSINANNANRRAREVPMHT